MLINTLYNVKYMHQFRKFSTFGALGLGRSTWVERFTRQWMKSLGSLLQFSAVDYRGWKKIPTVVASSVGHRFEISLSPEVSRDHDQVMMEWVALMNESSRICVYAAYLQPIADDGSLWTLARIKTENGYWVDRSSRAELDDDQ